MDEDLQTYSISGDRKLKGLYMMHHNTNNLALTSFFYGAISSPVAECHGLSEEHIAQKFHCER